MKRLFWIALGATAGVLVVRTVTRAAGNLTPDGAADRVSSAVGGLGQAVRQFSADVKIAMAERESELREALGIAEDGTGVGDPAAVEHLFDTDHSRGTY